MPSLYVSDYHATIVPAFFEWLLKSKNTFYLSVVCDHPGVTGLEDHSSVVVSVPHQQDQNAWQLAHRRLTKEQPLDPNVPLVDVRVATLPVTTEDLPHMREVCNGVGLLKPDDSGWWVPFSAVIMMQEDRSDSKAPTTMLFSYAPPAPPQPSVALSA